MARLKREQTDSKQHDEYREYLLVSSKKMMYNFQTRAIKLADLVVIETIQIYGKKL